MDHGAGVDLGDKVTKLWVKYGGVTFPNPARVDEKYIQNKWALCHMWLCQISYGLVASIQVCLAICSSFYGIVNTVLHVDMSD